MSCAHTKEDVCGVCIQALIADPEFREKAMRDFWPQEVARLQSQLEATKRENERVKVEEFARGVDSVLAIRCMEHRAIPPLNDKSGGGQECAICITAADVHGVELKRFSALVGAQKQQLATLTAENSQLKSAFGIPCSGCGMVYVGKPSSEPWVCDKCMPESESEIDRLTAENERLERSVSEWKETHINTTNSNIDAYLVLQRESQEKIATLTAENERLKEQRPHLIPEPECTCYEYIGGHQQGCPMYGMTPEGIRKWQDDYSTQCHEIEETIQWKNLVESHDRLTASLASEKERADSNFESCERVKQKFSEATASLAEVTKEVEQRDYLLQLAKGNIAALEAERDALAAKLTHTLEARNNLWQQNKVKDEENTKLREAVEAAIQLLTTHGPVLCQHGQKGVFDEVLSKLKATRGDRWGS